MRTLQDSSSNYKKLLQSEEWRERRKQILQRNNYTCKNCGSKYGLEVHHRQYFADKVNGHFIKPWLYDDHNLITLCNRCHQIGHKKYNIPVFNV